MSKRRTVPSPKMAYCPLCREAIQHNRFHLHIERYCGFIVNASQHTNDVTCPYCQQAFPASRLRAHFLAGCGKTIAELHPIDTIQCPDCGVRIQQKRLASHQRKCPARRPDKPALQPEQAEALSMICPDCQTTIRRKHFDRHRRERCPRRSVQATSDLIEETGTLQKCPDCGMLLSSHLVANHRRQHHERRRKGQPAELVTLPPTPAIAGDTRPRTKEGYVIETCSSCRRRVCLVEGPTTWYEFNIVANRRGDRHVCDGESVPYREFIFGTRHANYDRKNRKKR